MAHDRESILQQYRKEITHILKATTADPKDEAARLKVATTLARVLSFTKIRTGEDRTPKDTEVYKVAAAIRRAKSREQFETALQQAIPKAKSRILEKYNLAWNLPWLTEQEQWQEKKPRGRRARKTEVSEPVPDINARIDVLEEAVNQIQSQLSDFEAAIKPSGTQMAKQIEEVLQKLKAHQHDPEDGKAYILEKKEL
jgi:outer membrane murein-binding lipoprotein Lpp